MPEQPARAGAPGVSLAPGDDTFVADLKTKVRETGVEGADGVLSATDVQLNTTPARNATALEAHWTTRPFPERYRLESGRWPSRPGEVAVTEPDDLRAPVGSTLEVLGDVRLKVVGTVDDRPADTTNLLFGPGTWADLDPALHEGFPALAAQLDLMWSGDKPNEVVDAFTAAARTWTETGRRTPPGSGRGAHGHRTGRRLRLPHDQGGPRRLRRRPPLRPQIPRGRGENGLTRPPASSTVTANEAATAGGPTDNRPNIRRHPVRTYAASDDLTGAPPRATTRLLADTG